LQNLPRIAAAGFAFPWDSDMMNACTKHTSGFSEQHKKVTCGFSEQHKKATCGFSDAS
jgi:hypothetical protein